MLRTLCLLTLLPGLVACGARGPVTPDDPAGDRALEARVRAPSAGSPDQLQVFGVRNSAVVTLGRQAREAERAGDLQRARSLLERALRIDGRDAQVLQQMAELQVALGDLEQAGSFAARAFEFGPKVGEICERSLRTLMLVHERAGEYDRAYRAFENLPECRVAPPERF